MKRRDFLKTAGARAGRVNHCRGTGHRTVDARAEMALHDELAEVA